MCGRFTLRTSPVELAEIFQLRREPVWHPRYNIAPTQPVAVVRQHDGSRVLDLLRWGLIPSWSKDPAIGSRMINARGETVATKPSFRAAFKRRRCLIPADGLYEWKMTESKTKQPYFIGMQDDVPFAFAGLWEHWQGSDGSEVETCTIITTEANSTLSELHERMPVILEEEDYDSWLDPKQEDKEELQSLLVPSQTDRLRFFPVRTVVNSPKNEVPECVIPIDEQGTLFG